MEDVTKGIKEFYNDIAQQFADEWYANESLLPILERFVSLLGPKPRVLDLGCGAGYESMRLRRLGAEVVGIDFSEEPVRIARRENPDCRFYVMDFKELDESLGVFDGVAAIASLIHISDSELEPVFKNIKKVVRPGGYVLIIIVDGEGLSFERSLIERDGALYNRTFYLHRKECLDGAAESAGFRFAKELPLPEEIAAGNWRCFIYQSVQRVTVRTHFKAEGI